MEGEAHFGMPIGANMCLALTYTTKIGCSPFELNLYL